ncbi:hypothetical protein [Halobacillus litoralis]|uniref:hypothetical protein n=1 Tax=Halobacillus litoralis TaxID=45668 RepID=UPI001CFDE47D|nr:hypothetical protein [Halobacillus litoralis]
MTKRNTSPFDDFWGFNKKENSSKDDQQENEQVNFPDLFKEASKTWKSMSPMIKPMLDRFKK